MQRRNSAKSIPLHAACILLAAGLQAAPVTVRWSVDLARPAPADWPLFRGESLRLEPVFLSYGETVPVTNRTATLYWQTNGMDSAWWSAPAEIVTNTTAAGQVRATWRPTNDVGATTYSYFIGVADADPAARQYRAYGRLRMRSSPGYVPNEVDLPARAIDFDTVDISNAPWATPAGLTDSGTVWRAEWQAYANAVSNALNIAVTNEAAARVLAIAAYSNLVASTYLTPSGDGSQLTGLTPSQVGALPSNTTVYCAGGYRNSTYWTVETEPRYRGYATASTSTVDDVIQVDYMSDGQFLDAQASIDYVRGLPADGVTYAVSPTNQASVSTNGYTTTLSPGIVTISATIDGATRSATDYLGYAAGEEFLSWVRGVTGSLRRASGDMLDDAIAASGVSPDLEMLSVTDHVAGEYAWNSNSWVWGEADLSGVPISSKHPGGGFGAPQWSGTLISPRHIELPKHAINGVPNQLATKAEEIGTMKRFLGRDGTLYEREVIAHYDPYGDAPAYTNLTSWNLSQDTIIGLLDEALPTNNVAVYPVLPDGWEAYAPYNMRAKLRYVDAGQTCLSEGGAFGGLFLNQDLHVYGVELASPDGFRTDPWDERASVHGIGRTGDSGRPVFLWTPEGLVFLSTLTYPTVGHNWAAIDPDGTHPSADYRARIEAILALHGESLTDADFSEYSTFGDAQ